MYLKPLIYYVLCGVLLVVCRNTCFGEVEVSLSSNVYTAKKLSDVLDVYVATDSGSAIGFKEAEITLEHSIYGTVAAGHFALNRLDSFSGIIKPSDSVIISTAEIDSRFFLELMDKEALPAGRYYLHVRLSSDTDDYRTTQSFYVGKNDSAAKKKALFKPYLDVVSSTNYSYYSGAEPPNNARDAYVAVNGGVNILDIPFGINMLLTSDYKTVSFGYTPVFLELNTNNLRQTLEDKFLKNIDRDKFKMQFSQERLKGLLKQKDELLMQLEALKSKLPEGAISIKNAWREIHGDSLTTKDSALYKIQQRVLKGDSLVNGFGERIKGFMGSNARASDSLYTPDMHAVPGMADKVITDSLLLKRIAKLETSVADIDEKAEGLKKILASLDVPTLTKDYKDPGKIKNALSRSKYFKKAERLIYSIKNLKLGSFSVNGSRYFMSSTPFLGGSIELDWRSFYVRAQAGVIQGNGKFMNNLKHPYANVYVAGLGYHASDEHFSYDEHGNIKLLVQEYPMLEPFNRRYFTLEYNYDLISGNANKITYQKDREDQWIHRYTYNTDNELLRVETSTDGRAWYEDMEYDYYAHGPLKREVLGNSKVQGTDYAYTIHGFIKGVNSGSLNPSYDLGKDGEDVSGIHGFFGRDAFGYNLGYYAHIKGGVLHNDYHPVKANGFEPALAGNYMDSAIATAIYNGNISRQTTALMRTDQSGADVMGHSYRYDYTGRLARAHTFLPGSATMQMNNSWSGESVTAKYKEFYHYDKNGNIKKLNREGHVGAMDDLTYNYVSGTNKLAYVNDNVVSGTYADDIDNQKPANYSYDADGNLVGDTSEGISKMHWNAYGKVKQVDKSDKKLYMKYGAGGLRIMKIVSPDAEGDSIMRFIDVHDEAGNIIASYTAHESGGYTNLRLVSRHIYGNGRIGMLQQQVEIAKKNAAFYDNPSSPDVTAIDYEEPDSLPVTVTYSGELPQPYGDRQYELSNHLGNVQATISDVKIPVGVDSTLSYYKPDVIYMNDYYSFGMEMPGRRSHGNRFGFNGQEKVNEVAGFGNTNTAEFWMYDTRLGRRWEHDPIEMIGISPYSTFANNPVIFSDPYGLSIAAGGKDEKWNGDGGPSPGFPGSKGAYELSEFEFAVSKTGSTGTGASAPKAPSTVSQFRLQQIMSELNSKGLNMSRPKDEGTFRTSTYMLTGTPEGQRTIINQRNALDLVGVPTEQIKEASENNYDRASMQNVGATLALSFAFKKLGPPIGKLIGKVVGPVGRYVGGIFGRGVGKTSVRYSDDLVRAAQKTYPNLAGKIQLHHPIPQFLGGPKNQVLVPLDAAYHQMITNEFRKYVPYGKGPINNPSLRKQIADMVYKKFPLPAGFVY